MAVAVNSTPASTSSISATVADLPSDLLSRPYRPLSLADILQAERDLNAVLVALNGLLAIEGGAHV